MKKMLALLASALLVGLLVAGLGYYLTRDAPPPDAEDLRVERADIAETENAFYWFSLAAEELWWPEDGDVLERLWAVLDGDAWDGPLVAELLDRNAEALRCLETGLACSLCQVPEPVGAADTPLYLEGWRWLGQVVVVRSIRHARAGDCERALKDVMQLARFGHIVEDAKGDMLTYLLARALKAIAVQALLDPAMPVELPPERLCAYARQVGRYGANEPGLQASLKADYWRSAATVDRVAAGEDTLEGVVGTEDRRKPSFGLRLVFRPNKTKALLAEGCRQCIANVPHHYAAMELPPEPGASEGCRPANWVGSLASGNPVGEVLVALLSPTGARHLVLKCEENVGAAALQLVLALRAFELENGQLPESLDDLVPHCLDAVPLDDFDGRPMRYSRQLRIVYSVGEDLVDDGGSEAEPGASKPDLSYPLWPKPEM